MQFFHSFSSLDIQGVKSEAQLKAEAEIIFKHSVSRNTVLDIGAWDGWFSFRAEALGARMVTASDWFCWNGPGWGSKAAFDHIKERLESDVRELECDIPDLDPEKHGQFDTVLLLGVLYHVTDMLGVLQKAQAMTRHQLVIETVTMPGRQPVARYWPGKTLSKDDTNFWTPTPVCVIAMLSEFGFTRFEVHKTPYASRSLKSFVKNRHWLVKLLNPFVGNKLTLRHIIHGWKE